MENLTGDVRWSAKISGCRFHPDGLLHDIVVRLM
nr:MAG TPA: Triple gene block 3 [Caudoviricetes sp.]